MLLAFLAAITMHAYAATPERAVIQILAPAAKNAPIVRRVNRAGRYAMVLTSGGKMEGSRVTEPILVERFSFGWQPLTILTDRCFLDAYKFSGAVAAKLLRGMTQPAGNRRCRGALSDSGPPQEVDAVRKLMAGPLVPYVIVSRDWAIGEWYGAGGGQDLFHRKNGAWRFVAGGGGEIGVEEVRSYGVPQADWCALGIHDAKCKR
jgi:hypothetical protein